MKRFFGQHGFLVYLGLLFWVILILVLRNFPSLFSITLTFLGLIFIPGFLISRIFKIDFTNDRFGNLINFLAIGFIYNIFFAFLGLAIHININQLIWLNLIIVFVLFVIGLIIDKEIKFTCDIAKIKFSDILLYGGLFSYLFLVLITVIQLGGNFVGDPIYHLAAMRKAISGQPLSIENIAYLKDQFHPAYFYSPWHILLAQSAKIANINIFSLWQAVVIPLTIMVFMVWYWVYLKIFNNKFLAVFGLILSIIYIYWQNGYLFSRLAVPDTLSTYLLLPLALGLAIKYIFSKTSNLKHLAVLTFFVGIMTAIHQTQWLYYLLSIGFLLICYAIFKSKDDDYKQVLKKICLALFSNFIVAIPVFLIIQVKGGTLSEHLGVFQTLQPILRNDQFVKWEVFLKLSYVFLPLVLLFSKKYRALIFIIALFLIGPLIHNIPGLKEWAIDNLSHVFVKRMYSSVGWAPAVLALVFGFLLLLFDKQLFKVKKGIRYFVDSILGLILLIFTYLEFKNEFFSNLYEKILGEGTLNFLNSNYLWLVPLVFVISLIIFIWQKYNSKLIDFFEISEPKEGVGISFSLLIIAMFLLTLGWGHLSSNFNKQLSNPTFFKKTTS